MPTDTLRTLDDLPLYLTAAADEDADQGFSNEDVNYAKNPVGYHLRAFRELGPIYRIKFRNEMWVAIGGLEANDFAWRNPDLWSYQKAMAGFGEELGYVHVTTLDGPPHRLKRRSLKPGFGVEAVTRHLPEMAKTVAERFDQMKEREIDLYDFCAQTIILASSRTMVETELTDEMLSLMAKFEEMFMYGVLLGEFRHAYFADPGYLNVKNPVFEHLEKVIREHACDDTIDDNLARLIRDRPREAGPYSLEEKLYDTYLLLIAGAENTTKLINWAMLYIYSDTDWLEELREELEDWMPESFRYGLRDYPKLKATIMEVERLQPGALNQARVTAEEIEFLGCKIPADTRVLHNHTLCHFLEEVYEDPFAFKPQRWLDEEYPKKAHGTFGGGTHFCLGTNLTRVHAPVILTNLVKNYGVELKFQPDFRHVVDLGGAFHRVPLPARFVPLS